MKNAETKAKNIAEKLGMDDKLKENNMWNIAPIPKNLQHLSVDDDDEQDNVIEGYDDYLSTSEAVSLLLKDIDNLHANEVIDSSVKERANAISKNIILPLAHVLSEGAKKEGAKKEGAKEEEKTQFLTVDKGNNSVQIRKRTAVWLFQESERLSSDRLFRVRSKQPGQKS